MLVIKWHVQSSWEKRKKTIKYSVIGRAMKGN